MKDKIYKKRLETIEPFVFDSSVANVFDDMLRRSIPFYPQIVEAIGKIFEKCDFPDGMIFDLGSSTGEMLCHLSQVIPSRARDMVGLDNSQAMVDKAQQKAANFKHSDSIQFINADIMNYSFLRSSSIISNFTLQFIEPKYRLDIIKKIYDILNPGGLIIVCEKIEYKNSVLNPLYTDIYYDFKKSQGYSELEIAQKREALENVMILDTCAEHINRMSEAGFQEVSSFFQWFNFAGFMGIKNAG